MTHLTRKELTALTELMEAEALAGKKANMYANTLTDTALAQKLSAVSTEHGKRYATLLKLMGGKA
ncbi:MAG: hypothetical protein J5993_04835 [Clostridia bacterium]|nr:hypothetical protein [Clostridia bacterium]